MKNMKKFLVLLLALMMVFGMTACSSSDDTEGDGTGDDTTTEETVNVAVFWYDESDTYLSSVRSYLNDYLDAANIEYTDYYAGNTQSTQIDQINTAISAGADLLVVNVVTSGSTDVAEEIISAAGDIPIIFFNRAIGTDDADVDVLEAYDNISFIGTDAPEAGVLQGEMIAEYLMANYDATDLNGDGYISYAMMKGDEANVEAIYRTQYSVEAANEILVANGYPELVYFDSSATINYQVDTAGNWSASAANEYMTTNLVSFNEANNNMIELVICNNDAMAEGVVAALQTAGYNVDGATVIPVFGVDATDNAIALIAEGAMTGTVKQDADGMAYAITSVIEDVAAGSTMEEALASLVSSDDRFSIADTTASKLYVAYSAYTGE